MLKKGIYEHVINQITKQHIHEIEQQVMVCMRQNIDEAESPQILANYFGKVIRQNGKSTQTIPLNSQQFDPC